MRISTVKPVPWLALLTRCAWESHAINCTALVQCHLTSERQNPERQLSSSSTSSRSTKHCKDPCTPSSQKLVVFFLICGSSIASIKLSHWHPEVNFESPVIIPLIRSPSSLYLRIGWTQYLISFSLFKKREDNKITLTPWRLHLVLFCDIFCNRLINTHRNRCARFLCMMNF